MIVSVRKGRYVAAVLVDRWGFTRQGPWTTETLNGGRPIFTPRASDDRVAYLLRCTLHPQAERQANRAARAFEQVVSNLLCTPGHGTLDTPDSDTVPRHSSGTRDSGGHGR
jgi:hypothetical protein